MELRTTREMRRNEQLSKAMAQKAETAGASAQAQQPVSRPQAPADKLSVSAQAVAWLEEQNRKMWESVQEREERKQGWLDDSLSAMESKKKELDALSRAMDVMKKCQKIAASIMKGDKVPPEDMEYLMNNDPDGFKLALAMRREKKDPEDCESVLDDEDRNGAAKDSSSTGVEAAPVESPAPSGGGDAAPAESPAPSGGGDAAPTGE